MSKARREIAGLAQCCPDYVMHYDGSFLINPVLWIIVGFLDGGFCLDILEAGVFSEARIVVVALLPP
jgi:serine/threonine-protein kinase 24/25/MST4